MRAATLVNLVMWLATIFVAGCHDTHDINTLSDPLKGRAETALRVLQQEQTLSVSSQKYVSGSGNLVVLIGENHASTLSQTQVAAVLGKLHDAGVLDAVLVEGSHDPLNAEKIAETLGHDAQGAPHADFWRRQLEWGRIAGDEYFELEHPDTPAIGIEDRSAELDYDIAQLADLKADVRVEELRLAGERLRAAAKAGTSLGSDASVVRQQIAELDAAATRYKEQLARAASRMKALAGKVGDVEHKRLHLEQLEAQLRPLLQTHDKVAEEVNTAQAALKSRVEAYNEKVRILSGRSAERMNASNYLRLQSLSEEKSELEAEERRIEALAQTAKDIETQHAGDIAKLNALDSELSQFASRGVDREIREETEATNGAQLAAYDIYFRAANRLRDLGKSGHGAAPPRDSAAEALAAVDRFFLDERKREEELDLKSSVTSLHGRDVGMARNAEKYLKALDGKVVVAIVGYAHLTGMTGELARRNISTIGGSLAGNAINAFWETEAWSKRQHEFPLIFSTHKEASLMLDPNWATQMAAAMAWMDRLDPHTNMQLLGNERVAHVGKYLEDQRSVFGEQVVLREPASRPGEILEIWDRGRGRSLVSELSGEHTQFAYAFLKKPDDDAYTVQMGVNIEQSLGGFMTTVPAPGTRYVVLFHEPDAQMQSGILVSAVWDALRPADAGGNGKPPGNGEFAVGTASPGGQPSNKGIFSNGGVSAASGNGGGHEPPGEGPWYQAGFWEGRNEGSGHGGGGHDNSGRGDGGSGDGPGLLRTLDPRRAARNIAALERQKRLDPKEITVLDQLSSIEQIPFTPRDGEAAGLVVLVARNDSEFRRALQQAADTRKLQNKQVALITCGDSFSEAPALREMVLSAGALMIWTPNRQISESAGNRLAAEVKRIAAAAANDDRNFRDIDQLMNRAVGSLRRTDPSNAELLPLMHSGSFVLIKPNHLEVETPG